MFEHKARHLLPEQIMEAAAGRSDSDAVSHLNSCRECMRDVEEWRQSRAEFGQACALSAPWDAKGCPSMENLAAYGAGFELADGLIADHVLRCVRCASILREALETGGEPIPDRPLLWTASGIGQRSQRTETFAGSMVAIRPRRRYYWPVAVAAGMIALSVIWWNHRGAADPNRLLAEAYTAARPFEYRLPDAGYGRVRQERGANSAFDRPAELVSAEAEIQHRLTTHPEDPSLLGLKGRAQLLERDYEGAIASLTRAEESNSQAADVMADLATAYAVRGEVEKRNTDLGHAIDLFSRAIKAQPADQRFLFNLALTYEKLWLVDEAVETWHKLLQQNPPPPWRREAEAHLASMENLRQKKKKADEGSIHDPQRFLASRSSGEPFDPLEYHEIFWKEWLPRSSSDPAARNAARMIARAMQMQYNDASLAETLANANSTSQDAALSLLAQAISDNQRGHVESARTEALASARALDAARLPVAALRARVELSYAYRWATKYRECAALTESVLHSIGGRYPWLAGSAHLEHVSCIFGLGEIGRARAEVESTRLELTKCLLWPVALRAQSFEASLDGYSGNYAPVWESAVEGLGVYWASSASFFRAQSFQVDLGQAASILGWRECAVAFYRAAIRSAHLAGNSEIEASNRSDLAGLYQEMGDIESQVSELRKAEELLSVVNSAEPEENPAIDHLRWQAKLRRVEAEVAVSHAPPVLRDLEDLAAGANHRDSSDQIRIAQARGAALLAAGNWEAAEAAFRNVVESNQRQANSVRSWVNRIPVLESAAPSYRNLTQIDLVQRRDDVQALRTWRLFRPAQGTAPSGIFITIATLPAGIVVWKENGPNISARWVGAPAGEIRKAAESFTRLCASPSSSQSEIRRLGNTLFRWLLAAELESSAPGTVTLSADSWLESIPISALTDNTGEYLGRRWAFVESYGSGGKAPASDSINAGMPALIVSVPSAIMPGQGRLPLLSGAEREASDVASRFPNAVVLRHPTPETVAVHISRASLFHFTGHGWANGGNGSLVLPPAPGGEPQFVTSRSLAGQDWSNCRLAVLSACLTAAGEERGVVNSQSLVQAILGAGAHRVVAARWSVDSEASRALMNRFYMKLAAGKRVPEALALASAETSAEKGWEHPYFWAGFDVFGAG